MKLLDLTEMTMRTGGKLSVPSVDFSKHDVKFVDKMQHGYDVVSFDYLDTIFYGVKINNDIASWTQLIPKTIPKYGRVYISQNSKTELGYAGQKLSIKLKMFLTVHLGYTLLMGDIHSIDTENLLKYLPAHFDVKLVNIKTGDDIDWSIENYHKLTNVAKITPWKVLLIGNSEYPMIESHISSFDPECSKTHRHIWTYGEYFEDK